MTTPTGDDRGNAAASLRRYRASPGGTEYKRRENKRNAVRRAAVNALIAKHTAEFARLYESGLRRAGLWPPQRAGRRGAE
jgi:hypothetical protein